MLNKKYDILKNFETKQLLVPIDLHTKGKKIL